MKNLYAVMTLSALLFSSFALAEESDASMDRSSCLKIVKACKAAGYERKSEDQKFWRDCMKPLLLGKKVKGVKMDEHDVKACREKKMDELQKELKELQAVQ